MPTHLDGVKLKQLTYDIGPEYGEPYPDQFLVTLGKKGIGSVYHIATVRAVKSRTARKFTRWALGVLPAPELKGSVERRHYEHGEIATYIMVNGIPEHWCWEMHWYPR
jgi:hypothetical protein